MTERVSSWKNLTNDRKSLILEELLNDTKKDHPSSSLMQQRVSSWKELLNDSKSINLEELLIDSKSINLEELLIDSKSINIEELPNDSKSIIKKGGCHSIKIYCPDCIFSMIRLQIKEALKIKDLKAYNSLNANIRSCELKLW